MITPLGSVADGLRTVDPGAEAIEALSAGYEAEIFAYRVGDARRVLRLFPDRRSDGKSAWEGLVHARVREAGYPAPRVHRVAKGDDSPWNRPFLLMDRVEGESLGPAFWGPPSPARDAAREAVFGLMARLHALDAARVFREVADGWPSPLGEVAASLASGGAAGAAMGAVLLPALRSAMPPAGRRCVLHGDLHGNNVLRGPDGCAVIDWSNARPGDPRQDVAWVRLLVRADDEADGGEADLARYERAAGGSLGDLRPFEALGAARILAQGLAARAGDGGGLRAEAAGSFGAGAGFGRYLGGVILDRLGVDVSGFVARDREDQSSTIQDPPP